MIEIPPGLAGGILSDILDGNAIVRDVSLGVDLRGLTDGHRAGGDEPFWDAQFGDQLRVRGQGHDAAPNVAHADLLIHRAEKTDRNDYRSFTIDNYDKIV